MKRYRVEFSDEAKNDIMRSYEWGREKWGRLGADRWYRELKLHVRKVLTHHLLAQTLAPEMLTMRFAT